MSFNFRTVTFEQLKTIDGVGDSTAAAIIRLRDMLKGTIATLEDLLIIVPEANKGPTKKALQNKLIFEKTPPQTESQDARKTHPKTMEEIIIPGSTTDKNQQLQDQAMKMIDQRNQRHHDLPMSYFVPF